MKDYFKNVTTLNDAKNLFKKLCFELHPDTSNRDSQQEFIKMFAEFQTVSNQLKFSTGFDADTNFNADAFYNIVKKFEGLNNIQINFVGSFIWLTDTEENKGAMYEQKDLIKDVKIDGYNVARWAKKKLSWYFSPADYSQKGSSNKSLDQLKTQYQTNVFLTPKTERLRA